MILTVCVDDRGGLLFNGRRQSQDRVLRERLLELTGGRPLWMSPYSAGQFAGQVAPNVTVDAACLDRAGPGEFCFAEEGGLAARAERVEGVVLCRWNRVYPADTYFDLPLEGWTLTERGEFAGSSHETITLEVYAR